MVRRLSDRLVSLAGACVVTFGLLGGIHSLAASDAASAAFYAQTGPVPVCARV